ncbi:RDD family protein [Collimonas silvisoli]|uniref:RDD family protein n=1 Tax=Collimonas silvisoli TaxID=2825884 RepID=UPI001E57AC25|nr:RDD family protein [Collimonas silvisoli]
MEITEPELEYVGFWLRVVASLVDTVLVLLFTIPLMLAFYGSSYWSDTRLIKGPGGFLVEWILPAVLVMVFWLTKQSSPGKMLIGARIVDEKTGGIPTTGQFIWRYAGYYLSILGLFLGYLWVAFDKKKQGWHDKLAGTVVVRNKKHGKKAAVSFQRPGERGVTEN